MPKDRDQENREKGSMTVEEAGRMGGEKVRDERGPEFYSEIGHKGGQRVKELIEEGKESEQRSTSGSTNRGKS